MPMSVDPKICSPDVGLIAEHKNAVDCLTKIVDFCIASPDFYCDSAYFANLINEGMAILTHIECLFKQKDAVILN